MTVQKPIVKSKDAPDLGVFSWSDPFYLEQQLSEEERMLKDASQTFAQEKLQPRVTKAFQNESIEPDLFKELGEMGLLGTTIPEEYGGLGAGYVSYGLVAREIERVDSGYRSMMSVQSSLVMYPIYAYGTEEQRKNFPISSPLKCLVISLCPSIETRCGTEQLNFTIYMLRQSIMDC